MLTIAPSDSYKDDRNNAIKVATNVDNEIQNYRKMNYLKSIFIRKNKVWIY